MVKPFYLPLNLTIILNFKREENIRIHWYASRDNIIVDDTKYKYNTNNRIMEQILILLAVSNVHYAKSVDEFQPMIYGFCFVFIYYTYIIQSKSQCYFIELLIACIIWHNFCFCIPAVMAHRRKEGVKIKLANRFVIIQIISGIKEMKLKLISLKRNHLRNVNILALYTLQVNEKMTLKRYC